MTWKPFFTVILSLFVVACTSQNSGGGTPISMIGKCEVSGSQGQVRVLPVVPGQLTVQTDLPSVGMWNGSRADAVQDGFEYCLAAHIAHRLGLGKIVVQDVDFVRLVGGQTSGFDLAMSQITITAARSRVVDFSTPYYALGLGLVGPKHSAIGNGNVRAKVLGVQSATASATFLFEVLRHPPSLTKEFSSVGSGLEAARSGLTDAFLTDLPIALSEAARSNGALAVLGQYRSGERLGILFPKGSPLRDEVNRVLEALDSEGTITRLARQYLGPAVGGDPTAVPIWSP